MLLERGHAGDVIVQLLLRHHHTVLLGQAQEDSPGRQLFEGHLTEVKAFVEVHSRLGTEDSPIALLQRIVHALEVAHVARLAKNRRHFRACRTTAGTHSPLIENRHHKGQYHSPEDPLNKPGLGLAHPL